MSDRFARLDVDDGGGVVRLNRPDQGNAMTLEMMQGLLAAALHGDEAEEVRTVALTGEGNAFSVGGISRSSRPKGTG